MPVWKLVSDKTLAQVQSVRIDTAASGDTELIGADADKTFLVLSLAVFNTGTAVDIYFNDGTADLLGDAALPIKLDATGAAGPPGFVLQHNDYGWFETAAVNRALNINLSTTQGVGGVLRYVEVDD